MLVNGLAMNGVSFGQGRVPARPQTDPFVQVQPKRQFALLFGGDTIKLMSYNAQNLTPERTAYLRPHKVAAKADVMLREDADVMALQEVGDRRYMQSFNRVLLQNRYSNVVGAPSNVGHGIRVATLSKPDIRIKAQKSHWQEINAGDPRSVKRDFLETTFETKNGFEFTTFNGHFKSMNGGEEATLPKRLYEAQVAARITAAKLKQDSQYPFVVMGDFNSLHHTPQGQRVLDTLALRTDNDPTNDLTEVFLKDDRTIPTHCMYDGHTKDKLDYIFVSPGMLPLVKKAYVAGRFRKFPWKVASDHLPAVVVIEEPDNLPGAKSTAQTRQARPQTIRQPAAMGRVVGNRLHFRA